MMSRLHRITLLFLIPVLLFGIYACSLFENSVQLSPEQIVAAEVSLNAVLSFQIPVWCGERKVEFSMDDDFTLLEQYDTEIEIVLPQKRILGIFPGGTTTSTLVEKFTVIEPSNFQTPGEMTLPVYAEIASGKTIRLTCDEVEFLPTTVNDANNVTERLSDALSEVDYFHGVLTLETDTRDLRVFKNEIVRSFRCVDQGSGLDCVDSQLDRNRMEIDADTVSISQDVELPAISNLDLVVVTSFNPTQFCPGDGSGSFSCSATSVNFAVLGGEGAAAGDFNEDGNLDFVITLHAVPSQLCLGDGVGDFACSAIGLTVTPSSGDLTTTSGDYNEDGHMDFVTYPDFSPSQICAGDGMGGFTCTPSATFNWNSLGGDAVTGDFNNDNDLDTVIVGDGTQAQLCAGNGAGAFACSALGAGTIFAPTGSGYGAAAGDFNSDDNLDFITLPEGLEANLCTGDGAGNFTCAGIGETFDFSGGIDGAGGDFDQDGNDDFAVKVGSTNLQFCKGDGAGGFTCSEIAGTNTPAGSFTSLLAGDFDAE